MSLVRSGVVWGWLLLMTVAGPVRAAPASPLALVPATVLSADSTRVKLMAYLARGDIAGAIAMYETSTGRVAPAWLTELQAAYGVANQAVGRCQEVARVIHTAFLKVGQTPQYIAFKNKGDAEFMVFQLTSGRTASVSHNKYHVAVRIGDSIYDAYTGPLGMKLNDYIARLHAQQGISWEVVANP